jgi:hypothetical protein
MTAKFSTRLLAAAIHGLFLFVLLFFVGILIEGALFTMGAMTTYHITQFEIAAILGALGFTNSIAYELSRRLDEETTKT